MGGIPAFVGPLVIWLVKRREDGFASAHALEALNFNLSVLIYVAGFVLFGIVTLGLGFILFPIALIGGIVAWFSLTIVGAVRASNGDPFRYPLTLRLVK